MQGNGSTVLCETESSMLSSGLSKWLDFVKRESFSPNSMVFISLVLIHFLGQKYFTTFNAYNF